MRTIKTILRKNKLIELNFENDQRKQEKIVLKPVATMLCLQNDSFFVVARFDLNKTRTELLIAVIVPSCLFVISFVSLVIIQRSVQVGDDAKMHCRYCVGKSSSHEGENLVETNVIATTTTPPQQSSNVAL